MEQILDSNWSISSAGGASGEAYVAESYYQKLFLKRNTSPFLAILSAEGIVPKLVWTKRLTNGDVITAQQWLEGRVLNKPEMQGRSVVDLISKIHHSSEILHLFMRMEKQPLEPVRMLMELKKEANNQDVEYTDVIYDTLQFLFSTIRNVENRPKVVCHADINHENFLLSQTDHLYLIDWDNAVIADPAMDLSMMLYQYIPRKGWEEWLASYGVQLNNDLLVRIQWYMAAQSISYYLWHLAKGNDKEAANWKMRINHQPYLFT
ncbi:phosphotransferase family protein [Halalkalibacillus halophilus]|uniref:phosphotransferase family protein n=1 Tax=Halalkalibacillus halophilus TaxID=392827 RepID=UPI000428DF7D|nr:phosphotransferase family protein [Halalkalibacillus halophilus]